jgi:hypothetical protein
MANPEHLEILNQDNAAGTIRHTIIVAKNGVSGGEEHWLKQAVLERATYTITKQLRIVYPAIVSDGSLDFAVLGLDLHRSVM